MTEMTLEQRAMLEPHAEHYIAMARHVRHLSDDDLTALLAACYAASVTNCGWGEFQAAQYLQGEIRSEQLQRHRSAQRKAAAALTSD